MLKLIKLIIIGSLIGWLLAISTTLIVKDPVLISKIGIVYSIIGTGCIIIAQLF